MPHLTIDYAPVLEETVDFAALCRALYDALIQTGVFPLAGIRVRAHRADHCVVADGLPRNGYVALTLAVGAGRDSATLRAAGDRVFAAAQAALAGPLAAPHCALSLDIRVSDPALSWKDNPMHTRLAVQS